MAESPLIRCQQVDKRYRTVHALRGIDLEIEAGTLVAVLGPNGAGKTTLVRILTTLTRPTSGRVLLFGHDASTHGLEIRKRIGVVPQENNLDRLLTARENLIIQAQLHGMPASDYVPRIERFLQEATLAHRAEEMPDTFSGGMQRRLVIARALLHDPPLLFLDEPTTGLDPQSRHFVWELVTQMKRTKTILLTTHYMEEAERLADRVVIVDEGRILIDGNPRQIKSQVFPEKVFRLRLASEEACSKQSLDARLASLTRRWNGPELTLEHAPPALFSEVLSVLAPEKIVTMGYLDPTLEDVFIKLTGKAIREDA